LSLQRIKTTLRFEFSPVPFEFGLTRTNFNQTIILSGGFKRQKPHFLVTMTDYN
jgi:hypothetical protein